MSSSSERARARRVIAAAEARAAEFLERAPRCDVCGKQMAVKRARHSSCEPGSLAGLRCTCREGCTDKAWGDQGTCDPACQPCKIMRGKVYRKP